MQESGIILARSLKMAEETEPGRSRGDVYNNEGASQPLLYKRRKNIRGFGLALTEFNFTYILGFYILEV